MANPQKENGYTAIANEIIDHLVGAQLSGQQFALVLLVIRKTYGYQKKSDAISLSQMAQAINSSRIRCSQIVKELVLMKILTVNENINGILKSYSLNKDFETWATVNKNINRSGKMKGTVNVLRNRPLMKTLTTKETITKETITKEKAQAPIIPEWIPKQTFEEYLEMRRKMRKPLMERSFSRFFSHLKRLCEVSRATPEQILDQSIINGWQGIFELKTGGTNVNRPSGRMGGDRLQQGIIPPEYKGDGPRPDVSPETVRANLQRIARITGGIGKGGIDLSNHAGDEWQDSQNPKGHSGGSH